MPGGSPGFVPGEARPNGLAGGACLPLGLPPLNIRVPPPTLLSPRGAKLKPWGGGAPQPWMLSPRETMYRRQCTDCAEYFKQTLQARGPLLALLPTPRRHPLPPTATHR